MFVFFGKHDVIEEEAVVARHIYLRDVIRSMYLWNHGPKFVDGLTTGLGHLLGITIVSCLVYHIVEDIDQRVLENLTVLVLVIFSNRLKRYTDGSIPVSLQMVRPLFSGVQDMVIYSHVLLIALSVELQLIVWQ